MWVFVSGDLIPITEQQLLQILPNAGPTAGVFVPALNRAMARFKIDNPLRQVALLAQVGHESGHLLRLAKNLNYSTQGLANTWLNRFAIGPRAKVKVPNALAHQLSRRPAAIANAVYANRMSNSDEASGDGWRYCGRGLIQLAGRDNYRACSEDVGLALEDSPVLLEQPECAALSAAWYWSHNGLNELADAGRFEAIARKINSGTSGQEERLALWRTGQGAGMSLLSTASALLQTVGGLLDRLISDPEQKAGAQLKLLRLQQEASSRSWMSPCRSIWPQAKINEVGA